MEVKEKKKGIVELVVMGENDMVVKIDASQMGTGEMINERKVIRGIEQVGSTKVAGICCDGLCCDGLKSSSIMTRVILEQGTIPVVETTKIVESTRITDRE